MMLAIAIITLVFTLNYSVRAIVWMNSRHPTITRSIISDSLNIITCTPVGWIRAQSKAFSGKNDQSKLKQPISEVFYIPGSITVNTCDSTSLALHDEHICSQMTDAGLIVHVVDYNPFIDPKFNLFHELMAWRKTKRSDGMDGKHCAFIVQELAAPTLLEYLTRMFLLSTETDKKLDSLAAVIVLDCPPLQMLQDLTGRKRLLQRYCKAYYSDDFFEEQLQLPGLSTLESRIKWKAYREGIERNEPLMSFFRKLYESSTWRDIPVTSQIGGDKDYEDYFLDDQNDGFNYDKAVFLASLPKRQKKSKKSPSKPDNKITDGNAKLIVNEQTLLGPTPTRGYDVGLAMPHRLLFLSSFSRLNSPSKYSATGSLGLVKDDIDEIIDMNPLFEYAQKDSGTLILGDMTQEYISKDEWTFQSCQEISQLYQAGDAISVHPNDEEDEEDELGFYLSNDESDISNKQDQPSDYSWTEEDIKRHQRISSVIVDWLRMLEWCDYLPDKQGNIT